MIQLPLHNVHAEVPIVTPGQHDMYVRAVRGHKIAEAQISRSIGGFINSGTTARRMCLPFQPAGIERPGFRARRERSRLINPLIDPKFLRTKSPPDGGENRETDCDQDPLSAEDPRRHRSLHGYSPWYLGTGKTPPSRPRFRTSAEVQCRSSR